MMVILELVKQMFLVFLEIMSKISNVSLYSRPRMMKGGVRAKSYAIYNQYKW